MTSNVIRVTVDFRKKITNHTKIKINFKLENLKKKLHIYFIFFVF